MQDRVTQDRVPQDLGPQDRVPPDWPPQALATQALVMAEALAAIHVVISRLQMRARQKLASGGHPRARADELQWCLLEAWLAALRGETLTQKDLLAISDGLISAASLSRTVKDGIDGGLLRRRVSGADRRVSHILPGAAPLDGFTAEALQAFARLAALVDRARARIDALDPARPQHQPGPGGGSGAGAGGGSRGRHG